MYPEITHSTTLRVWGAKPLIRNLAERLELELQSEGEREPGRSFAIFRYSVGRVANLEEDMNRLMDLLVGAAGIKSFAEYLDAWIVVGVDEFSLMNLRSSTMKRLSDMELSISFENHI